MNRCSFCEWIPILPWPVWPLAGQFRLGQHVVVGSMMVLLALCGSMPRGVYLGPHFRYKCASPRLSAELPNTHGTRAPCLVSPGYCPLEKLCLRCLENCLDAAPRAL